MGFNSQWDEILPISNLRFGILKGVSIPNGMKFYTSAIALTALKPSFNSQWDEILPPQYNVQDYAKSVSIPNGMKFYPIAGIT